MTCDQKKDLKKKKKKTFLDGAWQNRNHAERILPLN